jgi:hypothetical protein
MMKIARIADVGKAENSSSLFQKNLSLPLDAADCSGRTRSEIGAKFVATRSRRLHPLPFSGSGAQRRSGFASADADADPWNLDDDPRLVDDRRRIGVGRAIDDRWSVVAATLPVAATSVTVVTMMIAAVMVTMLFGNGRSDPGCACEKYRKHDT